MAASRHAELAMSPLVQWRVNGISARWTRRHALQLLTRADTAVNSARRSPCGQSRGVGNIQRTCGSILACAGMSRDSRHTLGAVNLQNAEQGPAHICLRPAIEQHGWPCLQHGVGMAGLQTGFCRSRWKKSRAWRRWLFECVHRQPVRHVFANGDIGKKRLP